MKVDIANLPKSQAELTIEVPVDEFKGYVLQAAQELSLATSIPGFRPGKAPYDIVEKRIGAMKIHQAAAEKAVAKTYAQAIQDNKLNTVGAPQITLEKIAPGNPLVYKARVALLPQVVLGDYKKVKISKKEVKVEDKEIDETLHGLRRMFAKEKLSARQAQKGDKLEIDMDTYVDKIPIEGGTSKKHPIMLGEGNFIPGFEDNLIGLAAGQTKEFSLKFPKEYHRKDLAGRPVDFKVKIHSVYEMEMPAVDDSFAKMVGQFEKLEDLRKQIEQSIHREKSDKEKQRWELAVIEQIISKSKFDDIPDILIESELHKMLHELEHEVIEQGMKFEDYLASIKKSREDLQKEFAPQAERRIKTAIALRAIATAENITVTDEDLAKETEVQKKKYQSNAEVLKQIETAEFRDYMRNVMRSQKVFEFLNTER